MATELKRITFVITPDIETCLDEMKKEMFYNCSQSEMVRTLLEAGVDAIKKKKEENEECVSV